MMSSENINVLMWVRSWLTNELEMLTQETLRKCGGCKGGPFRRIRKLRPGGDGRGIRRLLPPLSPPLLPAQFDQL